VRTAARDGYTFSALVLGIVNSVPFQMKQQGLDETPATVAVAPPPAE